jgi:hypothetical protein
MKTENELKSIRYLLNDLILYVYDLRIKLDEIAPSKRKYRMGEPNVNGSSIGFDLFSIPKDKYKTLVDKYGVDVVNEACVKLDEFVKINEYIPYRTPYNSLNRRFIKEVLFDRVTEKRKKVE